VTYHKHVPVTLICLRIADQWGLHSY